MEDKHILVIDKDLEVLARMQDVLAQGGYKVKTTDDADHGKRMLSLDSINLVILDETFAGPANGALIQSIRSNPTTKQTAIMLATRSDSPPAKADQFEGWLWKSAQPQGMLSQVEAVFRRTWKKTKTNISSGNAELDSKMGSGIPVGSLTLIEGESGAGKSVLAQQIIWGSLMDTFRVTLFTSENSARSLMMQMERLSLDVLDFLLLNKLRVYSMEMSRHGQRAPYHLLEAMLKSTDSDILIVDSLTLAIANSSTEDILTFFEQCKRLCSSGLTLVVVVHSHALSSDLLVRIRSLCDVHMRLRTEQDGQRMVKTLEVAKVRGAEGTTGAVVAFEVEPGWGIRVIPISKARG